MSRNDFSINDPQVATRGVHGLTLEAVVLGVLRCLLEFTLSLLFPGLHVINFVASHSDLGIAISVDGVLHFLELLHLFFGETVLDEVEKRELTYASQDHVD